MENHYNNLNNNVFSPLSSLQLQFSPSDLPILLDKCDVDIPTTPLFSQAMDHLKKDNKKYKNTPHAVQEHL